MAVDLKKITNAMFYNRNEWVNITEKEKEDSFFIINRYLSKTYPNECIKLNNKGFYNYKSIGMDLWFNFFKNKPYPKDLWSKAKVDDSTIDKEFEKYKFRLIQYYNIDDKEIYDFYLKNQESVKEDIEYFKKVDNIK